jgi:flagellar biosynthesis/type III secretory pathway protein FliH
MRQMVYKEIKRCKWLEERKVPSMDTLEEIAKKEREEARLEGVREGERKGKLEGEREFAIRILSKRFCNQLTEKIKGKIRKADEKTIDYIGDNLLEITVEELKEIFK